MNIYLYLIIIDLLFLMKKFYKLIFFKKKKYFSFFEKKINLNDKVKFKIFLILKLIILLIINRNNKTY